MRSASLNPQPPPGRLFVFACAKMDELMLARGCKNLRYINLDEHMADEAVIIAYLTDCPNLVYANLVSQPDVSTMRGVWL